MERDDAEMLIIMILLPPMGWMFLFAGFLYYFLDLLGRGGSKVLDGIYSRLQASKDN